jgi:hypothetical protein
MEASLVAALDVIAKEGASLRSHYHFEWPEAVQQAVLRLRFDRAWEPATPLVAIVGGASSGKSTVFNNLLGGELVSRITAHGHATRGLIAAIHEEHRSRIERLLDGDLIFPGLERVTVATGEPVEGRPETLSVFWHSLEKLRHVILFDTPDFTSETARREGDVLLALLPWFDRILVVVDRERWFDRQSFSELRLQSQRLDQRRLAVFNSTHDHALSDKDREALGAQAERMAADDRVILEFRRGRGLCLFPPGTFEQVEAFVNVPPASRHKALLRLPAEAANRLLNQNEERAARLGELRDALWAVPQRVLPSERGCMTALMTPREREQLDIVWRVLRLENTKAWLARQTGRLEKALRKVPVVGTVMGASQAKAVQPASDDDREAAVLAYFESEGGRLAYEMQRVVQGSRFWDEVHRWTGLSPSRRSFAWDEALKQAVRDATASFQRALDSWNAKVVNECQGMAPNVKGAVGAAVLGIAVVLVAVPGPVTVLTLVAAKGAIAGALGPLAMATGAGALFGKQFGRLVKVVEEKLVGSREFEAVREAASGFRALLEEQGRRIADEAIDEARGLVLPPDDELASSLETLRDLGEGT